MAVEEDQSVAFAEYGPPSFFPRLSRFRCGTVSADAVYGAVDEGEICGMPASE
jgi:hypothetical protein